ncbi:MAG: hypothetical protein ACLP4V_13065 [Methylocella sp.]
MIARFYQHQGRVIGLINGAMVDAQKAAERIWSRRELRELLSRNTILELFLEYVGKAARGIPSPPLSKLIVNIVIETVQQLTVLVPIEETSVEGEFPFATAVLFQISRDQLDAVLGIDNSNHLEQNVTQLRERLYPKWAGRTVMRFELFAEPQRAQEIGAERAEDYMSLLQFYSAPATILSLVSHAAPRCARPYRTQEIIAFGPRVFNQTKRVAEVVYQFIINAETRAHMERTGLSALSNLARGSTCEYEENLLNSLLVYGRAFYQLDQNDKLLQVMTSIEMFALRNDSEPIQAALADRMAFAISKDPKTRQQIVQNLREAYSTRSGRTHHGATITDTETIEQFLRNAWVFFLTAIQGVGRYKTRLEFLDYLDRTKYGHGESDAGAE